MKMLNCIHQHNGENDREEFYYRFVMEGTSETGYKISGVRRESGPPSHLNLRHDLTKGG